MMYCSTCSSNTTRNCLQDLPRVLSAIDHVMRQDFEARSRRLRLHVVFALLLVELALLLSRRILVLLVLGDKVIHVALRFSELHLIHTLGEARAPARRLAQDGGAGPA